MYTIQDRWELTRKIFDNLFTHLSSKVKLSKTQTLLEFGIGKWGFGQFYKEKFDTVYGLDVEDYSSHHPGVKFLLYDGVSPIPVEDKSLDIIVSHSVLEHVQNLDSSLSEMNRILKVNGILYLTVNPLYYSSYGSHVNFDGKRLENWEHLQENSEYYLTDNPLKDSQTSGHFLNKMTSSSFLSYVGKQPWNIEDYSVFYETKEIAKDVDRHKFSQVDLMTKAFRFIGRKRIDLR
jgi:SAM-dependent methyltransferase